MEFKKGKINKKDVTFFSVDLEDKLLELCDDLKNETYKHGTYKKFVIADPKRRVIHKATMRDRILHRAIYRVLYPIFDKSFIFDSYSARDYKGVYSAIKRFEYFAWKLSRNNTKTVYVFKADLKKFFDSIDHIKLFQILESKIKDEKTMNLLKEIINSLYVTKGKGIPLGNLTSQIFSNIYLDIFDQYVKRILRVKYYIRYADDFVVLDNDKEYLEGLFLTFQKFLAKELLQDLNPKRTEIKKLHTGSDFLGWVNFATHRVLRSSTRKRMFKKTKEKSDEKTTQSYLGLLKHGNTFKLQKYFPK